MYNIYVNKFNLKGTISSISKITKAIGSLFVKILMRTLKCFEITNLSGTRKWLTEVIVILFLLAIILVFVCESIKNPIIIEHFTVPDEFTKKGITGYVIANKIRDNIIKMEETNEIPLEYAINKQAYKIEKERVEINTKSESPFSADSLNPFRNSKEPKYNAKVQSINSTKNEIEVQGIGLSIESLVGNVKEAFKIPSKVINGEVVESNGVYTITIRDNKKMQVISSNDLNYIYQKSAEFVMRVIDPIHLLQYYRRTDKKAALELIRQIDLYGSNEERAKAYNIWAALISDEDAELSISILKDAAEMTEDASASYFYMGLVYYKNIEFDKSRMALEKAIELQPDDADSYALLGLYYDEHENNHEKAVSLYEKALTIDPKNISAYFFWSGLLFKQLKYDSAIEKLEKIRGLNPRFLEVYHRLGYLYREKRQYGKSVFLFEMARKLSPDRYDNFIKNNLYMSYMGWTKELIDSGRYENALNQVKKAIQIDESYSLAYLYLADLNERQHDLKSAIKNYEKALELNSDKRDVFFDPLQAGDVRKIIKELQGKLNSSKKQSLEKL